MNAFFLSGRPSLEVTDGMLNEIVSAVFDNIEAIIPYALPVLGAFIGFRLITTLFTRFTGM